MHRQPSQRTLLQNDRHTTLQLHRHAIPRPHQLMHRQPDQHTLLQNDRHTTLQLHRHGTLQLHRLMHRRVNLHLRRLDHRRFYRFAVSVMMTGAPCTASVIGMPAVSTTTRDARRTFIWTTSTRTVLRAWMDSPTSHHATAALIPTRALLRARCVLSARVRPVFHQSATPLALMV